MSGLHCELRIADQPCGRRQRTTRWSAHRSIRCLHSIHVLVVGADHLRRMQTSSVMRWHVTACRWSFAESTHSRHDNEDRARADGVRIDCERATAAHDSRVREEKLWRSLGFDLRTHRLQFDRNQCLGDKISVCITEKSASQCYATVQSARFMNSKKSKRSKKKQKCSL